MSQHEVLDDSMKKACKRYKKSNYEKNQCNVRWVNAIAHKDTRQASI